MKKKKNIIFLLALLLLPIIPSLLLSSSIKLQAPPPKFDPMRINVNNVKEGVLWLDARKPSKFTEKHISGAILVDPKDWENTLSSIFEAFEPGQTIVVYCNKGCAASRSVATRLRKELGQVNIFYLEGGMDSWFNKK